MKNILNLTFAALALIAAGCSKESVEQETEQALAPVTVQVDGFAVSQGDMPDVTRGTAVASYPSVTTLTLAFFKDDGTEAYNHNQLRADASTYTTFGEFSLSLPIGSYTMVVIAYTGTVPFTLSSPTLATCGDERLQEVFVNKQTVNITSTAAVNLSAALDRVIARLGVASTDVRTAGAAKLRMTFAKGGRNFNPSTGLATTNTGFANTVSFSQAVGNTVSVASLLFLASDEQTMDVTLETLDADNNVLFTKTVNDVPLKRNRFTVLSGKLFSASATASSITVNESWLQGNSMDF